MDISVEAVEPVQLGGDVELADPAEDKNVHNTDSVIRLVQLHTENLGEPSAVNIINDEANILGFDRRAQIPA